MDNLNINNEETFKLDNSNIGFFEKVLKNNDRIKILIKLETVNFRKVHFLDDNDSNMYIIIICYEDHCSEEMKIDYDLNFLDDKELSKLLRDLFDTNFNEIHIEDINEIYCETIGDLYDLIVGESTIPNTSIDTFQINTSNSYFEHDTSDNNFNISNYFRQYRENKFQYKVYSNFIKLFQ